MFLKQSTLQSTLQLNGVYEICIRYCTWKNNSPLKYEIILLLSDYQKCPIYFKECMDTNTYIIALA